MSITDLNTLVGILLAVSLATERLVALLKNIATPLDDKPKRRNVPTNVGDREWMRRIAVQLFSIGAACFIAGFLGSASDVWDWNGVLRFGENGSHKIPVIFVGLLASGGSALWSSLLGVTSATKDLRKQAVLEQDLEPHTFQHG